MEKSITVTEYLRSKQLTFKEVEETFHLVKRIEIDSHEVKDKCINCENKSNKYSIDSEPWTGSYQCVACNSLIMILYSDRMGGVHTDSFFVFEQKNRPMYELYFKCDIQKDCIKCRHCGTQSSDKEDIDNLFCKVCNKNIG